MYSACTRNAEVMFQGAIFDGKNKTIIYPTTGKLENMEDYVERVYAAKRFKRNTSNIEEEIAKIDAIIEKSKPLEQSLTVYRNVDDIYLDGKKVLIPNIGDKFNDKAFTSTSLDGRVFGNRKIKLEIEIPAGTKVSYVESHIIENRAYKQQEILLGRNSTFEITELPYRDTENGPLIYKAKLVNNDSTIK
mgnify:FL=1